MESIGDFIYTAKNTVLWLSCVMAQYPPTSSNIAEFVISNIHETFIIGTSSTSSWNELQMQSASINIETVLLIACQCSDADNVNHAGQDKGSNLHFSVLSIQSMVSYPGIWPVYTQQPGPCLNIKTVFPGMDIFHDQIKTVVRPSYLYNGDSYTVKTTSLYKGGPLDKQKCMEADRYFNRQLKSWDIVDINQNIKHVIRMSHRTS